MEEPTTTRTDRIVIDEQFIEIYKALTERSNIEDSPFRNLKDVFMMAVCYGFNKGIRKQTPVSSKHTIRVDVFSEDDMVLLKAIAIATTGDVEVLIQKSTILTIAESYAQAGILDVKSNFLDQPGRPLWNVVELIRST